MFAPTSEQVNPHTQRTVNGSLRGFGEAIHTFYYDIYYISTDSSQHELFEAGKVAGSATVGNVVLFLKPVCLFRQENKYSLSSLFKNKKVKEDWSFFPPQNYIMPLFLKKVKRHVLHVELSSNNEALTLYMIISLSAHKSICMGANIG